MKAARDYLTTLPLSEFALARRTLFLARLEYHTLALVKVLPAKARRWGLARKLLNIFLRDALYTTYLAERYGLKRSELFYEIPLDSITTRHLRREAGRGVLPRWHGVKRLTPEVSAEYQAFAAQFAANQIAPVHLDTYWWGQRSEKSAA